MVLINKIYTKSGDYGKTVFSKHYFFLKCNVLICTIGDLDEANSFCGQSRYLSRNINPYISKLLKVIQNNLFDLGSDLVQPFFLFRLF
jgi:cob(I)alamin adenosyltransferase